MSVQLKIARAGPLVTIQDAGRRGYFQDGISASGPMDVGAFNYAGDMLGTSATTGLEITTAGVDFTISGGEISVSFTGGEFTLFINGVALGWNCIQLLKSDDFVEVKPGPKGNYGYIRFNADIDVPKVLGSRSTNLIVSLGGLEGRALMAGDVLGFVPATEAPAAAQKVTPDNDGAPIRFIWGIHADHFNAKVRDDLNTKPFHISTRMDRMGVRLVDDQKIFADARILSLVSEPVVSGDIQILGDGTPIILMRDHQPTGGYPRIGTVISADLDRFAQLRPGAEVHFNSVTVDHAQLVRRK